MTSGHLIAHAYLTLLGNIHFGHLHDTRRKFISDRNIEFLTTQLGIIFFILLQIIDDGSAYQFVLSGIGRPLAYLYRRIIDFIQNSLSEFRSLRHDIGSHEIFHTLRNLTLCQNKQLIDENGFQTVHLFFIFLVEFRKNGFVAEFRFFLFNGTRE